MLIAIDLDNTLLDSNHELSQYNLEMINNVKALGHVVVIATGRPIQLVKPYAEILGSDQMFIMSNGAMIGYPLEEKVLRLTEISKKVSKELIEYAQKNEIPFNVYTEKTLFFTPSERMEGFIAHNHEYPNHLRGHFKPITETKNILKERVIKVLYVIDEIQKIPSVKAHLGSISSINAVQSQREYIDCNHKDVSKGNALLEVKKILKIDDDIMAFGDQFNDVSMFKIANVAVVMDNATEELKTFGTHIADDHNKSGVGVFLKEYFNL
jgi:Cof subfamily protein (haloacid dehalogenase superfamily)